MRANKWHFAAEKRRERIDIFTEADTDPVIINAVRAITDFRRMCQFSGAASNDSQLFRNTLECAVVCCDVHMRAMLLTSHSETTAAAALQPALSESMDNSVVSTGSQGAVSGELDDLFAQLEAEISAAPPAEQPAPKKDTEPQGIERREAERRTLDQFAGNLRLTVPGAADAKPIDLSETGFLLETSNRMRPGSIVEVFLRFNGTRQVLRAAIVRSVVHSLTPKPLFRTAFKFEEPTKLPERP